MPSFDFFDTDTYGPSFNGHSVDPTIAYYQRETGQLEDAAREAEPSAQEQALMQAQIDAMNRASTERKATRAIILGKLGLKLSPDGKGLVKMSDEDRRALMSSVDRKKEDIAGAYMGRAKAAASGETKLPSFLKKDVDLQAEKEKALLKDMLGDGFVNSTAGQQMISGRMKEEEGLRQRIQEQDLATAPRMAQAVSGQVLDKKSGEIDALTALPYRGSALMGARAGVLGQLQEARLREYNKKLQKIEGRRSDITSLFTVGGLLGGGALAGRRNTSEPETYNYNALLNNGYSSDGNGTLYQIN